MEQENTHTQEEQLIKNDAENLLDVCKNELNQWKDRCLRVTAEFDNYKKREMRDRQQWERIAQQEIVKPLLSVIDNFERAFAQQEEASLDAAHPWLKGVALITKEFGSFLDKIGVQPIQEVTSFDPELHEAVMQVADSGKESGAIVAVLEKGYRFKGNILRPARVSVAQ